MSAYFKVFSTIAKKLKGNKSKVPSTITSVKPKVGSLTRRRKDQDDVIKSADKAIKKNKLTKEQGVAVKKTIAPGMKEISKTRDKIDKLREKKMGGGMMGRRMGYSQGTLKPVDPKKQKGLSKLPKKVRNKMGYMKKGGRA